MSTLDRLRELVRGTGRPAPSATPNATPIGTPSATASARAGAPVRELVYEPVDDAGLPMPVREVLPDLPGASLCETPLGRCVVVDRVFDSEAPHGRMRVEDGRVSSADVIGFCEAQMFPPEPPPGSPGSPGLVGDAGSREPSPLVDLPFDRSDRTARESGESGEMTLPGGAAIDEDDGPVMFLDLETTGLSGGAGTVAFLVGCGFFDAHGAFRTRQFLLPGFAAERALLQAVTSCLADAGCLVTYNGRTFDLPVMETRWLFHRQPLPWTDITHLDMLHVSRRLWRARGDDPEASCRLGLLEHDLFGVVRVGDAPGWEIPGRYFDYIRRGDAGVLEPVLHHNRLDLLSLAMLTARAIRLLRDGLEASRDPREWLSVGRELLRLQQRRRAEACFRAVVDCRFASDPVRAEALYAWARMLRRARRYQEAAGLWQQLVACRAARAVLRVEAREALAVHYEHRDRDLEAAHRWASDAFEAGTSSHQRDAVAYRLARLRRKMAVRTKGGPKTAFNLPLMTCD